MTGDETRGEAESPTDVARLADAEGAGVEALIAQEWALHLFVCTERSCGTRVRYSELTDDANTHWHVKPGLAMFSLTARDLARDAEVRRVVEEVRTLDAERSLTEWMSKHVAGHQNANNPNSWGCTNSCASQSALLWMQNYLTAALAEIEEGSP